MTMTFPNVSLVRVIDGDTIRLDLDLGFNTWRMNEPYRLARVNSPELSTVEGIAARDALKQFLVGRALTGTKKLTVVCHGKDKYGRWLIELVADNENVNDWLVRNGLAKPMTLEEQKQ